MNPGRHEAIYNLVFQADMCDAKTYNLGLSGRYPTLGRKYLSLCFENRIQYIISKVNFKIESNSKLNPIYNFENQN